MRDESLKRSRRSITTAVRMSNAADRCVHWQADWGAGQTHCRACRRSASHASATLLPVKSKSGALAVAGVTSFLQSVRKHLSPVVDCSGGNALAGKFFVQAMHQNAAAWGDMCEQQLRAYICSSVDLSLCSQRARHQPQVEGLVNAVLSLCSRGGDGNTSQLRGATVVELGAGKQTLVIWPCQFCHH